jgi:hypothetical protein
VAIKHCANCGAEIEGRMTEKCSSGSSTHRLARADYERQETEERAQAKAAAKSKEK